MVVAFYKNSNALVMPTYCGFNAAIYDIFKKIIFYKGVN